MRALPPARPAAGTAGETQAGGASGVRPAGERPRVRRCRGGVRTLPRSLFSPAGQEFQTPRSGRDPPARNPGRPSRSAGCGRGKRSRADARALPAPAEAARVAAGRRRAGLRGCAGSHRPARALFTGERRRAHMEVTAPTPISRERPAAAVPTARRGGGESGGSEAGTRQRHALSRRALRPPAAPPAPFRALSPAGARPAGGGAGARRAMAVGGGARGPEGSEGPWPGRAGPAPPQCPGGTGLGGRQGNPGPSASQDITP